MQVKQRNHEQVKFKEQRVYQKQAEEQMLQQKNANLRSQLKEGVQMTKEQFLQKQREEADRLK